jgi:hypothetical protein
MGRNLNLARGNRRTCCSHTSRCLRRRNKPCENHKFLTNRTINSARKRTLTALFPKKHPNSNHQPSANLAQTPPKCLSARTRPLKVIFLRHRCHDARCSRRAIGARARCGRRIFRSGAPVISHFNRRGSTRVGVVRGAAVPPVTYVRVRLEAGSINNISHW